MVFCDTSIALGLSGLDWLYLKDNRLGTGMTAIIFYATTDGHTKKIAQAIAADWQGDAFVEPIERLPEHCNKYQINKVVIGASIRYGHYQQSLFDIVSTHRQWLARQQSAFFSVSLTARKPGKNDPASSLQIRKLLTRTGWNPDHITMFAGQLCYPNYRYWDRQMIRLIMTLTGGCNDGISTIDYTDWQQVRRFAKTVSGLYQTAAQISHVG